MLAHRIIPVMLIDGRKLVKGQKFDAWRSVGVAEQAARIHAMRGVDELILLDVAATRCGREPDLELVEELSLSCFMPLAVGGGIRSLSDAIALLRAGADKIVLCSGHHEIPGLLAQMSHTLGAQAIVVSIDVKDGTWWTRCGTHDTEIPAVEAAQIAEAQGAGEIMITDILRDGLLCGYNLSLIKAVSRAVSVPVIAAGGCGSYAHMVEAIQAGADAVASGAMFQFCDLTPLGAAKYLNEHNICARVAA